MKRYRQLVTIPTRGHPGCDENKPTEYKIPPGHSSLDDGLMQNLVDLMGFFTSTYHRECTTPTRLISRPRNAMFTTLRGQLYHGRPYYVQPVPGKAHKLFRNIEP